MSSHSVLFGVQRILYDSLSSVEYNEEGEKILRNVGFETFLINDILLDIVSSLVYFRAAFIQILRDNLSYTNDKKIK